MPTVAVVSTGAMGSALAHALVRGGVRVVATITGRSERTAGLAERAGAELLADIAAVVREADVVLSVVPPKHAEAVVRDIVRAARAQSSSPLLVELNAIAPSTVLRIEAAAIQSGIEVVDGSISGPPPWKPGTRVYLSGPRAEDVAALPFERVVRIVVGDEVGAASAVKMSTASVYKGSSALLLQALRAADANGVLEHVLEDLRTATPELVENVELRLASAVTKSGRYVGEMHEIAATQAAAGLTLALFEAMAEIYEGLAETPFGNSSPEDLPPDLTLPQILESL